MYNRLYLHIPFCVRKCPYCAFVSRQGDSAAISDYVDLLLEEMRMASKEVGDHPVLDSVYFGGGTPSLLTPQQVSLILDQAAALSGLTRGAEITLEVNPKTVSKEQLTGFRLAGVNRISLGVQTFDDRMLAVLGRIHTAQQARDAYDDARMAGFENIGIDLIHALPGQDTGMWRSDLEQALLLEPEHISIYGLTVEEGTPFAELYADDCGSLPDDDLAADMFDLADDLLTRAGFEHYEIANYARPGRYSRHNSGYWRRDGYLGVGVGAHSLLRDSGFGTRFSNSFDPDEYKNAVRSGILPRRDITRLSQDDAMAECMFLGLRMAEGVAFATFEGEFGVRMSDIYGKELAALSILGLITLDYNAVRLTGRGMLLSNQVFSRFLR